MYVTGPNQVLCARSTQGPGDLALTRDPALQVWFRILPLGTNRGVAILGDNVFMVTDNAHLIALNRVTGRLVWDVVMPDEAQKYGGTVASHSS